MSARAAWGLGLLAIVAAGILSRVAHTGLVILDKYLGDALYAAMVYALLRTAGRKVMVPAAAILVSIELFQLTMIPARLVASQQWWVQMCGRLMGTQFSVLDLLAYAVGLAGIWTVDARVGRRPC